jgi:hypothetical protein
MRARREPSAPGLGLVSLLAAVALFAAACGGGSAPTGTPAKGPPGVGTPAGATAKATSGAAATQLVIPDLCALVGAPAVSAALGEPVTAGATQNASFSSQCTFTAASGTKIAIAVTTGFRSLSSWEFQMNTLGMKAENKVPGIGEAAYAKASLPFGGPGASFSAYSNFTGVDVSISSSANPTALVAAATTIGKLLLEALP